MHKNAFNEGAGGYKDKGTDGESENEKTNGMWKINVEDRIAEENKQKKERHGNWVKGMRNEKVVGERGNRKKEKGNTENERNREKKVRNRGKGIEKRKSGNGKRKREKWG